MGDLEKRGKLNHSIKVGISFGTTSGIITTLGLIIGLYASTASKLVVIGGILTIAVADAMSDALGIHISEESENKHTHKEIWASTLATFFSKFLFALTFMIPILLFRLDTAVIISMVYGMVAIAMLSYIISKDKKVKKIEVILEHWFIAVIVIAVTYFVGHLVNSIFN